MLVLTRKNNESINIFNKHKKKIGKIKIKTEPHSAYVKVLLDFSHEYTILREEIEFDE